MAAEWWDLRMDHGRPQLLPDSNQRAMGPTAEQKHECFRLTSSHVFHKRVNEKSSLFMNVVGCGGIFILLF